MSITPYMPILRDDSAEQAFKEAVAKGIIPLEKGDIYTSLKSVRGHSVTDQLHGCFSILNYSPGSVSLAVRTSPNIFADGEREWAESSALQLTNEIKSFIGLLDESDGQLNRLVISRGQEVTAEEVQDTFGKMVTSATRLKVLFSSLCIRIVPEDPGRQGDSQVNVWVPSQGETIALPFDPNSKGDRLRILRDPMSLAWKVPRESVRFAASHPDFSESLEMLENVMEVLDTAASIAEVQADFLNENLQVRSMRADTLLQVLKDTCNAHFPNAVKSIYPDVARNEVILVDVNQKLLTRSVAEAVKNSLHQRRDCEIKIGAIPHTSGRYAGFVEIVIADNAGGISAIDSRTGQRNRMLDWDRNNNCMVLFTLAGSTRQETSEKKGAIGLYEAMRSLTKMGGGVDANNIPYGKSPTGLKVSFFVRSSGHSVVRPGLVFPVGPNED